MFHVAIVTGSVSISLVLVLALKGSSMVREAWGKVKDLWGKQSKWFFSIVYTKTTRKGDRVGIKVICSKGSPLNELPLAIGGKLPTRNSQADHGPAQPDVPASNLPPNSGSAQQISVR